MKSLAAWRTEARCADIAGRQYAYWTSNDGDTAKPRLLLIHGYPTSSWDWNFVWDELSAHFRLAAIDMLGFGLSEKPKDAAYSILAQADLQEALLKLLGDTEAHVLAHDYGDTVAQELLARHNDGALSFSMKSLTLLNGGLFPEQHRARPVQKFGLSPLGFLLGALFSKKALRRNFDQIFGAKTKPSDAEIDAHWALINESGGRRIIHRLLHYIPERVQNRERWVGALQKAAIPIFLIDGAEDPVSGAHMYDHFRKLVPNADAALLKGIGHYPQTEAPSAVAEAFLQFQQRLGVV